MLVNLLFSNVVLSTAFTGCSDMFRIGMPTWWLSDNRLRNAQERARTCQSAAGFHPDNWAGYALEVAMATFKGDTQPDQAEIDNIPPP